jgi:hypothetical protein
VHLTRGTTRWIVSAACLPIFCSAVNPGANNFLAGLYYYSIVRVIPKTQRRPRPCATNLNKFSQGAFNFWALLLICRTAMKFYESP